MRGNRDFCIEQSLVYEGGYVDHPKDPGGATNKGITLQTYRNVINKKATKEDLKKLSVDEAIKIYTQNYWDVIGGDNLPSGVDFAVYDFAINSGNRKAIKTLQKVVGVSQDGVIGPDTLKHTNSYGNDYVIDVIKTLCNERLSFMKRIKHRKTGALLWDTFGKGWSNRVNHVLETSLQLANKQVETTPKPVENQPVTTDLPTTKTTNLILEFIKLIIKILTKK